MLNESLFYGRGPFFIIGFDKILMVVKNLFILDSEESV